MLRQRGDAASFAVGFPVARYIVVNGKSLFWGGVFERIGYTIARNTKGYPKLFGYSFSVSVLEKFRASRFFGRGFSAGGRGATGCVDEGWLYQLKRLRNLDPLYGSLMVRVSPVCKKCKKGWFKKPALRAGKIWG